MAQLEKILRAPPLLVTIIWFAGYIPLSPSRIFSGEYWTVTVGPALSIGTLFFVFFVVWVWTLYEASVARLPQRPRLGRVVFIIGFCCFVLTLPIDQLVYNWSGDPPGYLLALFGLVLIPAAVTPIVQIWLAAKSLREFQPTSSGGSEWKLLLEILFLGIGIWFIRRRIETMLARPKLTEQPA
jgi:hypothetical protein